VDLETARALADINRAFYRDAAHEFSATRQEAWPGWSRVLEFLRPGDAPLAVLDVGCGNGRLAAFLDGALAAPFRYVGVDASGPLLDRARAQPLRRARARWVQADWLEQPPEQALRPGPFDLVALFGVLHHVPGFERRRALLAASSQRLAPGGLLALTCWQFESEPRLRRRALSWHDYNADAARPVAPDQLEPGDFLLRWGPPERQRLRYCHFADADEAERWTRDLPLRPVACFESDGREGRLNRYLLLRART
jgi:SAM-dependent methyltransferase